MLPQLIKIGDFFLPTYGVLVTLGFLAGLWVVSRLAVRSGLNREAVLNLGISESSLFLQTLDVLIKRPSLHNRKILFAQAEEKV